MLEQEAAEEKERAVLDKFRLRMLGGEVDIEALGDTLKHEKEKERDKARHKAMGRQVTFKGGKGGKGDQGGNEGPAGKGPSATAAGGPPQADEQTVLTVDNSLLTGDDAEGEGGQGGQGEETEDSVLPPGDEDEDEVEDDDGVRRVWGSWEQVSAPACQPARMHAWFLRNRRCGAVSGLSCM